MGPASTAAPPLKPANTGSPAAPSARYATSEANPSRGPSAAPVSSTASVWPVTGTGVKGSGMDTCAISAVNTEKPRHRPTMRATPGPGSR